MTQPVLSQDFRDLLEALSAEAVRFLVVGAFAMAFHGVPRATGDLDIWVASEPDNARRVMAALRRFGAPVEDHGVTEGDFARKDTVYQIGLPPRRIDVMTSISGVEFDDAWRSRATAEIDGGSVPFIGRDALVANKRASGREKGLVDLRVLVTQEARLDTEDPSRDVSVVRRLEKVGRTGSCDVRSWSGVFCSVA